MFAYSHSEANMEEVRNTQITVSKAWLFAAIIGLTSLLVAVVAEVDIDDGGGVMIGLGAVLFIVGGITSVAYFSRSRAFQRLMLPENQLAHWTCDEEEWSRFWQEETQRRLRENRVLTVAVGGMAILAVFIALVAGVEVLIPFAVIIAVVVFLGFIALALPHVQGRRARRSPREVWIGRESVFLNRQFHTWRSSTARLESVTITDGWPAFITIVYSLPSRNGRTSYNVRIPIPAGKRRSAEEIVSQLPAIRRDAEATRGFHRRQRPSPVPRPAPTDAPMDTISMEAATTRRRRWPLLLAAILLIAGGGVAWLVVHNTQDSEGSLILGSHTAIVDQMAFSPDGSLLVSRDGSGLGVDDPPVIIWDVTRMERSTSLSDFTWLTSRFILSPGGDAIAIVSSDEVDVFALASGSRLLHEEAYNVDETSLRISPDGTLLTALADSLLLIDLVQQRRRVTLPSYDGYRPMSVGFAPDRTPLLAVHTADSLFVLRATDGTRIMRAAFGSADDAYFDMQQAEISRDGRLCVALTSNHILVFDIAADSCLMLIPVDLPAYRFELSPAGDIIMLFAEPGYDNQQLHLIDARTGRLLSTSPQAEFLSADFSPDGSCYWMHEAGSRQFRVIDARTGTIRLTVTHRDDIWPWSDTPFAAAISPDGRRLATAGRMIRIWAIP